MGIATRTSHGDDRTSPTLQFGLPGGYVNVYHFTVTNANVLNRTAIWRSHSAAAAGNSLTASIPDLASGFASLQSKLTPDERIAAQRTAHLHPPRGKDGAPVQILESERDYLPERNIRSHGTGSRATCVAHA